MLAERETVLAALRLPAGTEVEEEPLSPQVGAPERVTLTAPGGERTEVLLRRDPDDERAWNHVAVAEALTSAGFPHMPRLLGIAGPVAIEEWVDGWTPLNLEIPFDALATGVEVLAQLHGLEVREGLRWGATAEELLPEEDFPLFRLGFASEERDAARPALDAMRKELLAGPFGFVHGLSDARQVLFAPGRTLLTDFGRAGFGHQLFDVAALLATAGLNASQRRELAGEYARKRGLDVFATIDRLDLATIYWGLHEQLLLPRRSIETLGDDVASEALRLCAARIERAIRDSAGSSAVAAEIRAALWPA